MTIAVLKDHIAQLREWANGNLRGGGMGSGLHAEKWPALTPGARRELAEHVMWLEQALSELEAAQQWRPMDELVEEWRRSVLGVFDNIRRDWLMPDLSVQRGTYMGISGGVPLGFRPIPSMPKEAT